MGPAWRLGSKLKIRSFETSHCVLTVGSWTCSVDRRWRLRQLQKGGTYAQKASSQRLFILQAFSSLFMGLSPTCKKTVLVLRRTHEVHHFCQVISNQIQHEAYWIYQHGIDSASSQWSWAKLAHWSALGGLIVSEDDYFTMLNQKKVDTSLIDKLDPVLKGRCILRCWIRTFVYILKLEELFQIWHHLHTICF